MKIRETCTQGKSFREEKQNKVKEKEMIKKQSSKKVQQQKVNAKGAKNKQTAFKGGKEI